MALSTKCNQAAPTPDRARRDWHESLDQLAVAYGGPEATPKVLDPEFGNEYEAERMPLTHIEHEEHVDMASIGVGGCDGRSPVVLRHSIDHPSAVLTGMNVPYLPLAGEIVGGEGSRTLVSVFPPKVP